MRDHWYGCKYDRQRKHDCVILDNEEWWNKHGKEAFKSIDFHFIHHQAINRLYEHFLFLKLKMISQLKRPFRVCKWRSIHCLKCVWPYSEFFWSVFSRIWTEYGEIFCISQIFCISLCSIRMRENTEQKNPNMDTFHAVFPLNTTHYIRRILSHGLTSTISQKRRIMFKNKSLSLARQLFLF